MSKDNGGPAFARPFSKNGEYSDSQQNKSQEGMSLRDYFAAKAMQAIVIGNNAAICAMGAGCAADAYGLADAMLAERAK